MIAYILLALPSALLLAWITRGLITDGGGGAGRGGQ